MDLATAQLTLLARYARDSLAQRVSVDWFDGSIARIEDGDVWIEQNGEVTVKLSVMDACDLPEVSPHEAVRS